MPASGAHDPNVPLRPAIWSNSGDMTPSDPGSVLYFWTVLMLPVMLACMSLSPMVMPFTFDMDRQGAPQATSHPRGVRQAHPLERARRTRRLAASLSWGERMHDLHALDQ